MQIRLIIKGLLLALKYGPCTLKYLIRIYKAIERDYNKFQETRGKALIQEKKVAAFVRRVRLLYKAKGNIFIIDDEIMDILDDVWKLFHTREPRRYEDGT